MKQMLNRRLYHSLRLLSALCTPFAATFLSFVVLLFFTYLAILPLPYRLLVLLVVYFFTIFFPAVSLHAYRRAMGWRPTAWRDRRKRLVPYGITFVCHLLCYFVMQQMSLPRYMYGILLGTLIAIVLSALANFRFKVSEHMIPLGGATAGVVIFGFLLNFNPLLQLSFFILLSGVVGSARIILKHHTAAEVAIGYAIGFISIIAALGYYFFMP